MCHLWLIPWPKCWKNNDLKTTYVPKRSKPHRIHACYVNMYNMCLHSDIFLENVSITYTIHGFHIDNPKTLPPATGLRNGKCFRLGYQFGYRYSMIYHLVLHLHGQLLFPSLDVWKYYKLPYLKLTLFFISHRPDPELSKTKQTPNALQFVSNGAALRPSSAKIHPSSLNKACAEASALWESEGGLSSI